MLKTAKTKLFNIFTKVDRQEGSTSIISRVPTFGPLEIVDYGKFLHSSKTFFSSLGRKSVKYSDSLESFEILNLLGEGMFSEVFLVKNLKSEEYFAMKIVEKERLVQNKQVKHALSEKLVLQGLNNPFTIYLVCFFMDNSYLYFVLPLIPCGELFKHLTACHNFSEQQTRFYVAQIVLALEYLHYLELIYRDLKPENVLMDHLGYLKLTDFGFCKRVKGRTYTFCGTPQYLSPEMVLGMGYSEAVDWWALGVFVFELSAGRSPFGDKDIDKMFENIVECRYRMDSRFSDELQNLIINLIQKDLTKRFGNLKGGVNDIKNHTWFRPINWLSILNRRAPADFIPTCESFEDKESVDTVASMKTIVKCRNVNPVNKYGNVFGNF